MTSPLRRLLADAVDERRRAEADALAAIPPGVFNHLASRPFILFWTIGRRTGLRREKYWGVFSPWGDTIYNIEEIGDRADWVRNVIANPRVEIRERVDSPVFVANARIVTSGDEEAFARALVLSREKGDSGLHGGRSLVVAFDAVLEAGS